MRNEYAAEISRIPLLSEEETKSLIFAMQNGDQEARKKLIKHNLRMVLKISNGYQASIHLPQEDLIGIGSLGLMKAIDDYDPTRNCRLSTFLYTSIQNTFNKYLYLSKMKKRDDSKNISLQDQIYESKDGDGLTLEMVLKDDGPSLEETIDQTIREETIQTVLKKLSKEERELLFLRYGIQDGIKHTLKEIAERQGVTGEWIRKKEEKALKKLRHPNITRKIKDFL